MFFSPENLRILKEPFGLLLEDSNITKRSLYNSVNHAKSVVSVGDATTDRLISYGIVPRVCIVDGRERRAQRKTIGGESDLQDHILQLKCSNPAGTISKRAVQVLRDALKDSNTNPVRVIVDGEEDLLTLPILVLVPLGSVVLYGQPFKGIVIVNVDSKTRKTAKDLMESLGIYWMQGYDDAVAV
ncbi:MAG: GTP-dependent dephospho-CoA kinase family protein [Candidatus Nitrosopolaris sp.]|jgi:GTP-dependent dephospho-CoA kinase